jgi:hypothetical protein
MDEKTDLSSSISTLLSNNHRMTSKNLFANLYQESKISFVGKSQYLFRRIYIHIAVANSSFKMQVYNIKKPKLSLDSLLTGK